MCQTTWKLWSSEFKKHSPRTMLSFKNSTVSIIKPKYLSKAHEAEGCGSPQEEAMPDSTSSAWQSKVIYPYLISLHIVKQCLCEHTAGLEQAVPTDSEDACSPTLPVVLKGPLQPPPASQVPGAGDPTRPRIWLRRTAGREHTSQSGLSCLFLPPTICIWLQASNNHLLLWKEFRVPIWVRCSFPKPGSLNNTVRTKTPRSCSIDFGTDGIE